MKKLGTIIVIIFILLWVKQDPGAAGNSVHQWVDGAPGARFLGTVREKIEKVETLCTI